MHQLRFTFLQWALALGLLALWPAAAMGQRRPPPAKPLTQFRFRMLTGGIVIVQGRLNDFADSLNFILDTGSGGISLDSALVDAYQLAQVPTNRVVKGIAGNRLVNFTYGHRLQLPGLRLDSLDFHINDYSLLSSLYGLPIHGIIGYSFFRRFVVLLDYDVQKVSVYAPHKVAYPRGGWLMKPSLSNLPYAFFSVTDQRPLRSRFLVDLGAGIALLLNEQAVKDSGLLPAKRRHYETQVEGVGGKIGMQLTIANRLQVGPYRFKKVPTYVLTDVYGLTNYPQSAGLVGNDVFRRFNTWVNYPASEIYLRPNRHFTDDFDYAYHGLNLYADAFGVIKVLDIIPGSPADKAGLKPDDVIIGVDNNFVQNLDAWKTTLQQPGTTVKITGQRNGNLYSVPMKIVDIR